MLESLTRIFQIIVVNITKFVAIWKEFLVIPVVFIIYFPAYKLHLSILNVLLLIHCISYWKQYLYNENLLRLKSKKNRTLFKQFKKAKKKYFVPIHERIFSLFPYFLLFFEIYCSYPQYSLLFIEQNFALSKSEAINFALLNIEPICYGLRNLNGSEYGIPTAFTFYFQYYFVGRTKGKFSYFTRYHFVFCILVGMVMSAFTQLFYIILPPLPSPNWFSNFLGLCVLNFWILIFFYGFMMVILGKQPIILFLDESIQYHIGMRSEEDEEFNQYDEYYDDDDDDEYD